MNFEENVGSDPESMKKFRRLIWSDSIFPSSHAAKSAGLPAFRRDANQRRRPRHLSVVSEAKSENSDA
jgi:hypothetical protein